MPEQRVVAVPEKPALEGLEVKWQERWEQDGTYKFDSTRARGEIFSIDTPPPTVSGSLHVGHVFSYTHTDLIARFQGMNHPLLQQSSSHRSAGTIEHGDQ